MNKPTFPVICIEKDKQVDIITHEKTLSRTVMPSLLDQSRFANEIFYDSGNTKWTHIRTSDKLENTFINRLLAQTIFFSRVFDSEITWTKIGTYELDELKEKINRCVEKDDDIITQFEEADVIKSAVNNSPSFDKLVSVLKKYVSVD
jgi:hypothetical protein